jgi:hypothetical protein
VTPATSGRDKRVLIVGVALVVVVAGGSRIVARTTDWITTARSSATSLVAELTRQEASIRMLPRTRDSLVARRVRLADLDSTILSGDTPELVGASLAELMSDLADATKAQVGNVQVRTDSSTRGIFVPVQVQASVTGDLSAVMRFLSKLEAGPKLLAVRELRISVQGDPSAAQGGRELLRADVVVEGLGWGRNPAPRQGGKR